MRGVAKVSWNPSQFRAALVLIDTRGGAQTELGFKQRTSSQTSVEYVPCWKSSIGWAE